MHLSENNRKYILLGVVIFIVLGLIASKVLASKQDEKFLEEDMIYQQVGQLYNEEEYDEASLYVNEMLKRQPKSEVANYLGGLVSANIGEYQQASILLQKTLDINPYKAEDPMFMLQFGEILFYAERYNDSKIVLEKCREWGWVPEQYPNYQERITELLTQIENM